MQANDVGEESLGSGLHSVGVCQGNEMAVFAEAIYHRQDHRLPTHSWQCLDEVQGDVRPNALRHVERQQEPGGLQVL